MDKAEAALQNASRYTGAGSTGVRAGMLRLLKYMAILAVLAVAGLWGYSYLLEPERGPRTQTIEIDAG